MSAQVNAMTEILILEKEAELYAAALRESFPQAVFRAARTEAEAIPVAGGAEAVVALAHEVSDALVAGMPKLRWIAALTTGTDHLDTLTRLPPGGVLVTSAYRHLTATTPRRTTTDQRSVENPVFETPCGRTPTPVARRTSAPRPSRRRLPARGTRPAPATPRQCPSRG